MISLSARFIGSTIFLLTFLLVAGTAHAGGGMAVEKDTGGVFDPANQSFFLTNTNAAGPAAIRVSFGPSDSVPTIGDFDDNATDTIGVFSPSRGLFLLNNTNTGGAADISFRFGPRPSTLTPIIGNWNGLSGDTAGLYDPVSGNFYLRNSTTAGPADITTRFGPKNSTFIPLAGNWTGAGAADGIGLYDPVNGSFFLKNDATTTGAADFAFGFGSGGLGRQPIVGDWDDDGVDTVGLYDPVTGKFFLKNSNTPGPGDITYRFGAKNAGLTGVTGNYNGD